MIHVHTLTLYIILFHVRLQYDVRGADSSFFVDDSRTADKLAGVDRKITTFKGFKVCYDLVMGVCVWGGEGGRGMCFSHEVKVMI